MKSLKLPPLKHSETGKDYNEMLMERRKRGEPLAGLIEATPDTLYPVRILEAQRENTSYRTEVHGLDAYMSWIWSLMNRDSECRSRLLDEAIAILQTASAQKRLSAVVSDFESANPVPEIESRPLSEIRAELEHYPMEREG